MVRWEETTALILAGGLGTRLRPVLTDRPKVLAPVAGRPFLEFLLDQLVSTGIRDVVLCVGYGGAAIEATFGACYGPLRLRYSHEPQPLGTAGALAWARPLTRSDPVLVLNGDSYCELDPKAWGAWYTASAPAASILATFQLDASRFGRVIFQPDGDIVRFEEKGASGPGWINAGRYLLSRTVLDSIPTGRAVSIERETFPAWVGRGLRAYPGGRRFLDIGVPESYAEAEAFFASRPPEAE
ncbi:MAG: nucleotidyltransferase family protein [Gemmataceae bacterium]|nr:nucleotidyltransferase family protein [Gemmataceae bacterium]MDW8264925.1 nucleotidyltransferase family protein [Gemmataceae bacterium]